MRARAEIETSSTHDKIVITEIPYGVNKAELIKNIADLANDKKIEGISNANDESDREGMRIVIDLSLIHISEPTRQAEISYAVFCLKKKKKKKKNVTQSGRNKKG